MLKSTLTQEVLVFGSDSSRAWTTKVWSPFWENCYVYTPIRHFFWLSLFSLPLCTFLGHFLSTPPLEIQTFPYKCALQSENIIRNKITTFGWHHAKVKSTKSNPPSNNSKICPYGYSV